MPKGSAVVFGCADDSCQRIPWTGPKFKISVFFSGFERSLATSAYNLRQDECKAAAYSLLAHAELEYGKFADTRLRDVPIPVFEQYKDRLPANFRKRAEHYFSEYHRAEEGAEAWRWGDLEIYGKLIFESSRSSVENYECGFPELITLYNIMTETDGIYGGRFSSTGFKGCCMVLINLASTDEVMRTVEENYVAVYPALKGKYLGALCDSADGVKL